MCLFDFVEQNNRIRFTPYCLGELTAFFVANISWRRSDQTRNAVLLLIFTHINTRHHVFVVEHEFCQSLCQFGLADAGRAKEQERTDRSFFVLQACTRTPNCICHSIDSLVLTDNTLVKFVFEVHQLETLAHCQTAYRNASPTTNYFCNILCINGFVNQALVTLNVLQFAFQFLDVALALLDFSVAELCNLTVVGIAFGNFGLVLVVFDILLLGLNLVNQQFFFFPLRHQ